jgi:clan AA aspartic protease
MKLLLDTHVFIWSKTNDPRMSSSAWSMLRDPANQLFMSSISVAEMAIKSAIGKLSLDLPLDQFVTTGMQNAQIVELPLRSTHAIRLASLPLHHRDPFDRLRSRRRHLARCRPIVRASSKCGNLAFTDRLPNLPQFWVVACFGARSMKGNVNARREAIVRLRLYAGGKARRSIKALIDTGYNGSLTLPPAVIRALRLHRIGQSDGELADGSRVSFDVYAGEILWHSRRLAVDIDEAKTDPLIGLALLEGSEVNIRARRDGEVSIKRMR